MEQNLPEKHFFNDLYLDILIKPVLLWLLSSGFIEIYLFTLSNAEKEKNLFTSTYTRCAYSSTLSRCSHYAIAFDAVCMLSQWFQVWQMKSVSDQRMCKSLHFMCLYVGILWLLREDVALWHWHETRLFLEVFNSSHIFTCSSSYPGI